MNDRGSTVSGSSRTRVSSVCDFSIVPPDAFVSRFLSERKYLSGFGFMSPAFSKSELSSLS
jgi:hypothetical protein